MTKRHLTFTILAAVAILAAGSLYVLWMPSPESPPTAPLVLDLDGDGIDIRIYAHAYFDMDSDGYAEDSNWISAGDGLLVLDEDGDGAIDNVREILGSGGDFEIVDLHRALAAGELTTGFNILRQWDENGDRLINAADPIFRRLKVWRDADSDGSSRAEELQGLSQAGIEFLSTISTPGIIEQGRSAITDSGQYGRSDGTKADLVSVRFAYDATRTEPLLPLAVDPVTDGLPRLFAVGEANSLSAAMSNDLRLRELVAGFTRLTVADAADLEDRTEAIIFRWYGADAIDPESRGPNIDGRRMTALERFRGTPWRNAAGRPEPNAKVSAALIEYWRDVVAYRMVALLAQVPLGQELFPGLKYGGLAFLVLPDTMTIEMALNRLRTLSPTDPAARLRYWRCMILALDMLYSEFKEAEPKDQRKGFKARFVAAINAALATEGVSYSYDQILNAKVSRGGVLVLLSDESTYTSE